jgi:hypothetical protein
MTRSGSMSIVLTASPLPNGQLPISTGPPDDDRKSEDQRMSVIEREFQEIQRRLTVLLSYIRKDTMAPVDPPVRGRQ